MPCFCLFGLLPRLGRTDGAAGAARATVLALRQIRTFRASLGGRRLRAVHQPHGTRALLPDGQHALGPLLAGQVLVGLSIPAQALLWHELLVVALVADLGQQLWAPREAVFHVDGRCVELLSREELPLTEVLHASGVVVAGKVEGVRHCRLSMQVDLAFQLC